MGGCLSKHGVIAHDPVIRGGGFFSITIVADRHPGGRKSCATPASGAFGSALG